METLQNMLEDVWNSQEGKVCSLVSWERFSSLQQAQVLKVLKVHVECCQYTVFHIMCQRSGADEDTFSSNTL